jgi:tripartite-type tricarboxylate transporter receptor subunit TctC
MKILRPILHVAFALLAGALVAAPADADPIADFYKGKQIVANTGGGAGGGFALAARILGRHMVRYIPGHPDWVVTAMPGAGGARSIKYVVNAGAQDGTVIGVVLPPAVISPLLRKGVGYDSSRLQWIGSITPMPSVLSVWHAAPGKSLDDARKVQLIIATSSKLSTNYLVAMFLNEVIGTKFKVISGYQGGDRQNVAMEKGEVHGRASFFNSYKTTKPDWLRDRSIIHLATLGPRIDDLKGVTHVMDLARSDEERQMIDLMQAGESVGHGFFVSPGVPKARVAALRRAFDATMKDPAFLKEAAERKQLVSPVLGEDLDRIVAQATRVSPAVVDKFKKMIRLDGPPERGGKGKKK